MIRKYQQESLDSIRLRFKQGIKRVLLWLATGAGKTFIFCLMVKKAAETGKRCIIVVRGRKLVDQASLRLLREHVPHGVLMAGHWNHRPHLPVQVCSIDTLISRKMRPQADLIIIDEAHMANSKGYKDFLSLYPDAFVVAVTATPWVSGGIRHIAGAIVHPISMLGLIEEGFLVPFRYFAPSEPDLTGVAVSQSTKDYVNDQLEDAMVAGQLTGKIVEHWLKIAKGLPTLCFAVNVHHSKVLVEKFLEAGVKAEHLDANTPDDERNEIIRRLEDGETEVVCNVGILGTGVDVPCIGAIIMGRPTKSRNLFIQQAGRGTRPFPGKANCILLDHSGNIKRHGLPTDESEVNLDGKQKVTTPRESKICRECFAVYRGKACPECGVIPPTVAIAIEETEDELVELTNIEQDPILRAHKHFQKVASDTGKKPAWAHYRLIQKFSLETVRSYLPFWFVEHYEKQQNDIWRNSPFKKIEKV